MSDVKDSPPAKMQERLEKHFRDLRDARDTSNYPIFALEHGLNPSDVDIISSALRQPSGMSLLSSRYWLLWVIYATEFGYNYAGDEYWGSFEKQTRGWEYQDRVKVKVWFRKFQKIYGGVIPSGPWAEHFSIIAWPITHAILPYYLQRQFAKLLYDLRFQLASSSALNKSTIGRLLSTHASHASTRFRAFLEQEELTGQIVAALLGGSSSGTELIHPPTLQRITTNLEGVRNAREWLTETRRVVSDRFKGIGQGMGGPVVRRPSTDPDDHADLDTSQFTIRPNLFLRHAGTDRWSAFLEVKSFRPLTALSPEIRDFLDSTRCRLNGADDFKPTGWLLSGDRKGALRSWPNPALPLIHFERPNPMIDHLLQSECRIDPGPVWLFRIGTDGIARHIVGRVVRPDLKYIVVIATPTPSNLEGFVQCNLDCTNVKAYRLEMPSHISAEMTNRLSTMSLQVARTIHVWPAGLPGRGWDGEGSSEWLTTESPYFGITHDHPMESLSFRLNEEPETLIRIEDTEQPVFIRLPPLTAGTHTLIVNAKRSPGLERVAPTPPAQGFLRLAIRDPEPWTPGVMSHPGLIIKADPDHADLDTFWRNKIDLSVNGPVGFAATFSVTLHSANGKEILSEQVGTMGLPITPDAWRSRFSHFLEDEERASKKYLEAATCTLTIRADTLGAWTRQFEHRPLPIRWVTRSDKRNVVVRLVDECDLDETDPEINSYSMSCPFQSTTPTLDAARSGYGVKPPGALFVAKHGRHLDAVLISSVPAGLQGLGMEPSFAGLQKSPSKLFAYFKLLGLWHDARLLGFLAEHRHRKVMDGAVNALRAVLCGDRWSKAEQHFREHPRSHAALKSLVALVDKQGFGNILYRRLSTEGSTHRTCTWFVDEAARKNLCTDREVSKFALRLAADQLLMVARLADVPRLESLLAKLINGPSILRAARLRTLILHSESSDAPDANQATRYPT